MEPLKNAIRINQCQLKNRLVMPPMATYQTSGDGKVTEGILAYYKDRADGGNIGLIVTEHFYISKQGKAHEKQISISDDSDIEGLKKLTDVIHQNGTKTIAQLNHAGSAAPFSASGMPAVAPSAVILPVQPMMGDGIAPEELTTEQIGQITEDFVKAAIRAKTAGYDGVEIHSAHAYLLNEFYSPLTNQRNDAYGGSLENRLRIHREVISAVRSAIGTDMLISIRLGGCDYMEGGSTIEDSVYASKVFEAAGADMISVSGGMCRFARKGHEEAGFFSDMSTAIKAEVSIPVLLTGGVRSIEDANALLSDGAADLIGVGRPLWKDAHWADDRM